MCNFVHLHAHSSLSFLDGYGLPEQIGDRILELGHTACAITDHGVVYGHPLHQKAMGKRGIKPIFGLEAYLVENCQSRTQVQESLGANAYPHITLLAKTQAGYTNLLRLVRHSFEMGFYYKPRIDLNLLFTYQKDLVVLSGCPLGWPTRLICAGRIDDAYEHVRLMAERIENYYVEIVPEPGLDLSHNSCQWLVKIANDLRLPLVATSDAHFPRAEDYEVQDLMLAIGTGCTVNDPKRKIKLPPYQFYCSRDEMEARMVAVMPDVPKVIIDTALDNSVTIAAMCDVTIPQAETVVFPKIHVSETSETMLWRLMREGVQRRWNEGFIAPDMLRTYEERAVREFDVLRRKGFCDYILAVADVVNYVKGKGGLVMCRGSAGGCILLWLLGTSETDPIVHDLSFERFYDDTRPDPPDVDIDFEKTWREKAFEYARSTYGGDRCAQVASLIKVKAKLAVQDAARAFGIPPSEVDPLSAALDSRDDDVEKQLSGITDKGALAVLQKYPQLSIVDRMIGQYRQSGIHAAGLLISSMPLDKAIGVMIKDQKAIAMVDKHGAADLGMLKMDFLSVEALDIIAATARRVWGSVTPLYSLKLDDPLALSVASSGALAAVFQLEGASAGATVKEIGIHCFEDLVAASALCRPGPNEWRPIYKANKNDPEQFERMISIFHPEAQKVIRKTNGILLYQEQVMALANKLAGMPMNEVHKLRKAITSSGGSSAMDVWREKFVNGCMSRGVSQAEAFHWWHSIESHGGYSFNLAHCVTYGIIGYWTLWLKAHHPEAFYGAAMAIEKRSGPKKMLLKEFRDRGGKIVLIDPKESRERFRQVGNMTFVGGFQDLKGIGGVAAKALARMAPFESWDAMMQHIPKATATRLGKIWTPETGWNIPELIELAPWFPVPADWPKLHGMSPGDLPGYAVDGTVTIEGFVVDRETGNGKSALIIEDSKGIALIKVPSKRAKSLGPKVSACKVADYVAVQGWWSGEVLYARDIYPIWQKGKDNGKTEETPS